MIKKTKWIITIEVIWFAIDRSLAPRVAIKRPRYNEKTSKDKKNNNKKNILEKTKTSGLKDPRHDSTSPTKSEKNQYIQTEKKQNRQNSKLKNLNSN